LRNRLNCKASSNTLNSNHDVFRSNSRSEHFKGYLRG
jgi:hypothetical protein